MNRQSGDPEAPSTQAAWLWHDLVLPPGVAPLSASPDLQTRIDALVLEVLRSGQRESARELSEISLGLSESAPHVLGRAFWQLAAGTFEALALQALSLDESLKRLVSQVLRQYSLYQVDPQSREVSELLCHDLLDVCLQAPVPEGAVLLPLIRQAYADQPLPAVTLSWPGESPDDVVAPVPALLPELSTEVLPELLPEVTPDSGLDVTSDLASDLAPMVAEQALKWSRELADELTAWAPKPSRPLAPTVVVLAQVLNELLRSAKLHQLAELAAALHVALLRSQRQISVLPHQAQVLVQAALAQHQRMQDLSLGQNAGVDALGDSAQLESLNSWPPTLQLQEQISEDHQGLAAENPPEPMPEPEPEPPSAPLPKVKRPVLADPDAPRLLYVQSISARWLKALQVQGLAAELVLHEPGVALVRTDLQQLAALLDLLLPALRLAMKADAPVLQITLDPAHDHLSLDIAWMQQVGRMPLDDLEMSQPWQLLLAQTKASLQPVGESAWRLNLPVQHLLCKVQVLRAGDMKLAVPARMAEPPAWFFGRNPPVAVTEVLDHQEALLQAPNPVMRRVHGVVGVMPKASGLPILVYRADLLRPQADYVFLSTP